MTTKWLAANKKYKELVIELIDAQPAGLGHIVLDDILFLEIIETKPKQPLAIKKINEPFITVLNKKFYVVVNEDIIKDMHQSHLELEMLRILLHIDEEPGKMKFPDVYEFKCILDIFGSDWREKPIQSPLKLMKDGVKIIH